MGRRPRKHNSVGIYGAVQVHGAHQGYAPDLAHIAMIQAREFHKSSDEIFKHLHMMAPNTPEGELRRLANGFGDTYERTREAEEQKRIDRKARILARANEFMGVPVRNGSSAKREAAPTVNTGPIAVPISASELEHIDYPEPKWVVNGVIAEGTMVLVGKGKIGKSWMALGLAISIASPDGYAFNAIPCVHGKVLYLALEDTKPRIKSRIKKILNGKPFPADLYTVTEWRKAQDGGLDDLDAWLTDNPDCVLVIIDTLVKLKRSGRGYEEDYGSVDEIIRLIRKHNTSCIAIWHAVKRNTGNGEGDLDDPIDAMQGTSGIGTAADAISYLKRPASGLSGSFYYRGRDTEQGELSLVFNRGCVWELAPETGAKPNPAHLSETQQSYYEAVEKLGLNASRKDVAQAIGVTPQAAGKVLNRMVSMRVLTGDAFVGYTIVPGAMDDVDDF